MVRSDLYTVLSWSGDKEQGWVEFHRKAMPGYTYHERWRIIGGMLYTTQKVWTARTWSLAYWARKQAEEEMRNIK
jgi:hypothetical protein